MLDTLALVFMAQLIIFAGQETIEALAAGTAVPSVGDHLLWGTLGQLPAAALAAAAITWLLTRVESAWRVLVGATPQLLVEPATSVFAQARWYGADVRLRLSSAFQCAFRKRGPPRPFPL